MTPPGTANIFELKETEASRMGMTYQAANGTSIENYGERMVKGLGD